MFGGGDDYYFRDVCFSRGSGLRGSGRWNFYVGLLEVIVLFFNFFLLGCVLVFCLSRYDLIIIWL